MSFNTLQIESDIDNRIQNIVEVAFKINCLQKLMLKHTLIMLHMVDMVDMVEMVHMVDIVEMVDKMGIAEIMTIEVEHNSSQTFQTMT